MRYLPPRSWPPGEYDDPPADTWKPPQYWSPRSFTLPLSPDGRYKLVRPPPGSPEKVDPPPSDLESFQLETSERMLGMWARAVQKDAHSYHQAAMRAIWTDEAIDHGEDWSPDEQELMFALEEVWIRGYRLVMSNYQMERWLYCYLTLSGEPVEPHRYRELRNALEHLDDASFTGAVASRSENGPKNQSIDKLPGGQLFLGFHSSHLANAFGVVSLEEVTRKACEYASLGYENYDDYEPSDLDRQWLREASADVEDDY